MYGYVYLTENLTNGKKYIGEYRSVAYNGKYLGEHPDLLADIRKIGEEKFSTKMLMPYESEKALVAGKEYWLKEYKGSNLYNGGSKIDEIEAVDDEPKPKRSRKKKEVDE